MRPVGFEPTIPAGERPKTYALDRAATRTGRGAWSVSATAQVNAHRPRIGRTPVNEDAIIAGVKR